MDSVLEMCLRPIVLVSMCETEDYWNEFIAHGEKDNVLFELENMDIESRTIGFKKQMSAAGVSGSSSTEKWSGCSVL